MNRMHLGQLGFRAEAFGARLHLLAQFKPVNAFVKPGIVVDLGGLRHLPAHGQLFQHERIQPCAGGVQRGGIAARAAADHDHIINVLHDSSLLSFPPGNRQNAGQGRVCAINASIFALDSGATIEPSAAPF